MKVLILLIRISIGVIEFLLGVRFILRLLGANAIESSFVSWVYRNSHAFVQPFSGIIPNLSFGDRFVLEFTTIIALAIYAIAAYVLGELIEYVYGMIKN